MDPYCRHGAGVSRLSPFLESEKNAVVEKALACLLSDLTKLCQRFVGGRESE